MRRLILIAGVLASFGACSSGGCDAKDAKTAAPAAEAPSVGGGSRGGTGESVSFQGLGKNPPLPGQGAGAAATNAAAAALGGSAPLPPQTVICGGFPNLLADCKTDPAYADLKKKCCPTGTVDQCAAIPGGARLIGHACSAQGSTFTSTPATAAAQ